MKLNKKKGIRLTAVSGEAGLWLPRAILAFILAAALNVTVFTACGLDYTYALISAGAVCILWAVLSKFGKEVFFHPVLLTVMLLAALIFRTEIIDGACLAWNSLGYEYTAATARVLPLMSLAGENEGTATIMFAVFFGSLIAVLSLMAVKKARGFTACVLPVLLLSVSLILKNSAVLSAALCMGCAVLLLLSSGWQQEREAMKALAAAATATAVLSGVLLAAAQMPRLQDWTANVGRTTGEYIESLRYKTEHSYLPDGDFAKYKNRQTEGYTALVVAAENPERMFLRGFVGDVFEDDVWTAADNRTLAENRELIYWTQKEHFYSQTQLSEAGEAMETESSRVSVQNINASSKYVYIPYTLEADSLNLLQENRLSPSALKTSGWSGQRNYNYRVIKDSAAQTAAILVSLQKNESEEVDSFLQAEAAYREFVKKTDLQIPESYIELLGPTLDACCQRYGGRNDLSLDEAQAAALNFLELCFAEDSSISLPLRQAQGSSFQYATVAALALRYYGIPARYAEGYEITEEMIKDTASGENIAVGTEMGRAWVEIYQQGIGWMPMEQTPGMEALVGQQSESGYKPVGIDGIDPNSQMGSEEGEGTAMPLTQGREQDNDNADKDDTDGFLTGGGTMVFIRKIIRWTAILVTLASILLVVAVIFRRFWLIRQKRQRFMQPDCREAVGWIYADAARMLSKMGMDRQGGSMETVCDMARQLSTDYGMMCAAMTELNGRALFSSKPMNEKDRRDMLLFRSETLGWLKERVKWYRKIWLRWGLCLY